MGLKTVQISLILFGNFFQKISGPSNRCLLKMAPNFSPKTVQIGAKTVQNDPKTIQNGSKTVQNGSKRSKTVQTGPNEKNGRFFLKHLHGGAVASRRRLPSRRRGGRGRGRDRCGCGRDGSKRAIYLSSHLLQLSIISNGKVMIRPLKGLIGNATTFCAEFR